MCGWNEVCLCHCWLLLIRCAAPAGGTYYKTVDIFNAKSGTWSTAALSVARDSIAATSLPNYGLAIFAGGVGGKLLGDMHVSDCMEMYMRAWDEVSVCGCC